MSTFAVADGSKVVDEDLSALSFPQPANVNVRVHGRRLAQRSSTACEASSDCEALASARSRVENQQSDPHVPDPSVR